MFGSDGSPIIQYIVIFAVIFAALAAIVLVVRPLAGRGLALPGRAGGRGRQPRLGIVDVYELDRARQLILLRRDNVEHLLLVGGPNDVVIERNIQRGQRPLPEARRPEGAAAAAAPVEAAPEAAARLPEPALSLPEFVTRGVDARGLSGRRPEPTFEMPVVVPPPVPRSGAAPAVTLPLDVAAIDDGAGQDPDPDADEAPAPDHPAAPAGSQDPAARPEPATSPAAPSPPAPPPLAIRSERRAVDPVILSDMARQLQAALARPASAVAPAAVAAPPRPADPAPPVRSEPAEVAPPPAAPAERGDGGPGDNPFSVEEIEAEFARLLGRPLDRRG